MYQVGMYCKHYKGSNLIEKNIYQIISIGIDPRAIDFSTVAYTGTGDVMNATDLVLYSNIFQENKFFVREASDISKELDKEKQRESGQVHQVEPLTVEEVFLISTEDFIKEKMAYMEAKQSR